jgi:hypothetical protein
LGSKWRRCGPRLLPQGTVEIVKGRNWNFLVSIAYIFRLKPALTIISSERGDPQKRPFLTRIYGMVGCLIVSLALIVLLVILQKKLPHGGGSYFHIPVRRDLETSVVVHEAVQRQNNVVKSTLSFPSSEVLFVDRT